MTKTLFVTKQPVVLPVGREISGGGWNYSSRLLTENLSKGTEFEVTSDLLPTTDDQPNATFTINFLGKSFKMESNFEILGRLIACGAIAQKLEQPFGVSW